MHPRPLAAGVLLLSVALAVVATGCSRPPSPGQTAPLDGPALAYSHLPVGDSLLPLDERSLNRGTLPTGHGLTLRARNLESADPSPYGCELTSQPHSGRTVRRSVYLYFPAAVVEAAGTEPMTLTFDLRLALVDPTVPDRTAPTGVDAEAPNRGSGLQYARQHVAGPRVRRAHCVVPASPRARRLVEEQLVRWGERTAAERVLRESGLGEKARPDLCPALVWAKRACVGRESGPCFAAAPWTIEYVLACNWERGGGGIEAEGPWPRPI